MTRVFPSMLAILMALLPVAGFGQGKATIRLSSGAVIEADITQLGAESLSFLTPGSGLAVKIPYNQIDAVIFPETPEWTRARQAYEFGRYAEAAELFGIIAGQTADPRHGHPAPGNYASLARRRQIDCLRRLGDAAGVARHLPEMDVSKLPAAERNLPPVLNAWAAAAAKDWSRVIAIASEADATVLSDQGSELAYLTGLAQQAAGQTNEALIAWGRAYSVPDASGSDFAPRSAMEQALIALETADEKSAIRQAERRSLAHLYAMRHGRGKLWDGAPPRAVAALTEPLTTGEAALGLNGKASKQGDLSRPTPATEGVQPVATDGLKPVIPKKSRDP